MSVYKFCICIVVGGILSTSCLVANAQVIEWEKSYGDPFVTIINELIIDSDGGFVSVGVEINPDSYRDLLLLKTSSSGEVVWQQVLARAAEDIGHSINPTSDGGYIVTGRTNSINGNDIPQNLDTDIWIIKFSEGGIFEWEQIYGGEESDRALDGFQTADGGYIVTAISNSIGGDISNNNGVYDAWVLKLSIDGTIEWERSLGGSSWDRLFKIVSSNDGGYVLAGSSFSDDGDLSENSGFTDVWVVKLNAEGEIIWQRSFGGSSSDDAHSIQLLPNGGYILAGSTLSSDGDITSTQGDYDIWVLELSAEGELIWQKNFGGTANDRGRDIQLTSDGGYILIGSSNSLDGDMQNPLNTGTGFVDYWALKISATGIIEWERLMGGSGFDEPVTIKETEDGGFVLAGTSNSLDGDISSPNGGNNFWLVKLAPVIVGFEEENSKTSFHIYPNPASNNINIVVDANMLGAEYSIFNSVGQLVKSGQVNSENSSIEIKDIAKGFYVLQLQNEKESLTAPFVRE